MSLPWATYIHPNNTELSNLLCYEGVSLRIENEKQSRRPLGLEYLCSDPNLNAETLSTWLKVQGDLAMQQENSEVGWVSS